MNKHLFLIVAAIAALLAGCRTNKQILTDYEREVLAGNYAKMIPEIEGKAEDGGVDELLWRLHVGSSRHLVGERAQAIKAFDDAEDIFIRNDRSSVFEQGAIGGFAMVSNDRAFPYCGAGQDRIFSCLYKAINYAADGRFDATRTELNRASLHQDNWLDERRREIADARERLKKDSAAYAKKEGKGKASGDADTVNDAASGAFSNAGFAERVKLQCGFDTASDGNLDSLSRRDWLNAYASHVTGVFRTLSGDGDGIHYLREAADVSGSTVARGDVGVAMKGDIEETVWVYVEDGLCPVREEWRIDLPLVLIPYANKYILYAGMALPYLRYRSAAYGGYELSTADATSSCDRILDVDKLMKLEYDVYFRGALTREVIRTVVKVGVQVGFGIAAEHASGHTSTGFTIAQFASAAWAASVTQADLRSWTALPKQVFVGRVKRPADGKISIRAVDGSRVAEVTVRPGNSMVFVSKPSPIAPAAVRAATITRNR